MPAGCTTTSFNPPPALLRGESIKTPILDLTSRVSIRPPHCCGGNQLHAVIVRQHFQVSIRPPHCCGGNPTRPTPRPADCSFNPPPALLRGESIAFLDNGDQA